MLSKDDLVLIGTLLLENRTSREIRQAFKIGNGKLTRFRMILDEHSLTAEDLKEVDEKEAIALRVGNPSFNRMRLVTPLSSVASLARPEFHRFRPLARV